MSKRKIRMFFRSEPSLTVQFVLVATAAVAFMLLAIGLTGSMN